MDEFDLTDLDRRVSRLVRWGTVAEANYEAARVRLQIGEAMTTWLPWITRRAGADIDWWAPSVGEQVIVLAPDGDLAAGVVLGSVYQTQHPAPDVNPKVRLQVMQDGAVFQYDSENSVLTMVLPGNAQIFVDGDVMLDVTGTLTALVGGDATLDVEGNAAMDVGGNLAATAGGNATVDAPQIALNGGMPVVTTGHVCHFTGNPHGHGSTTVKAGP